MTKYNKLWYNIFEYFRLITNNNLRGDLEMGLEAKKFTVLLDILYHLRKDESDKDKDFLFRCKFDGEERVEFFNVSSDLVEIELKGFDEIDCSKISLDEGFSDSDIEEVFNKISEDECQNIDFSKINGTKSLIKQDDITELKDNFCRNTDKKVILNASEGRLKIIGSIGEGIKERCKLILKCNKESVIESDISKEGFEIKGEPGDGSKFAGEEYKTNDKNIIDEIPKSRGKVSALKNKFDKIKQNEELTEEEIVTDKVNEIFRENEAELYKIFEQIRKKGKIELRKDKDNKILLGFNDEFNEAWNEQVDNFDIKAYKEKIRNRVRTRFRECVAEAKENKILFGKRLEFSDKDKKRIKIKEDLKGIESENKKLSKGLKRLIVNSYLNEENIRNDMYNEGKIKGIEDIKEVLRNKMEEKLSSEFQDGYKNRLKQMSKDGNSYKTIEKIFNLIGLNMPE